MKEATAQRILPIKFSNAMSLRFFDACILEDMLEVSEILDSIRFNKIIFWYVVMSIYLYENIEICNLDLYP